MKGEDKETGTMIVSRSLFTQRLIDWAELQNKEPGKIITDSQLTEVCGRDCSKEAGAPYDMSDPKNAPGRGYVNTAKTYILRNYGIVWERVHGAGCIKCLGVEETHQLAAKGAKKVARQARKTVQKLNTLDVSNMDSGVRSRHYQVMAQHGALAMFASPKAAKRLAAVQPSSAIDLGGLLENLTTRQDGT